MAFLMSAVDVASPSGLWQWFIIDVFGFISNYGWRIVVLVIFLKLLLSPLDFYQKYKMRKNQRITEALKPQMDKLEKQCGDDKAAFQRKQMELQKSAGFSYMSACLPLIITLVLFITFFTALRSVSAYMEFKQYVEMYDSYVIAYNETGFDYESRIRNAFALSDKISVVTGKDEEGNDIVELRDIDDETYKEISDWINAALDNEEELKATLSSDEILGLIKEAKIKSETDGTKEPVDIAIDELKRFKTDYSGDYKQYVSDNKGRPCDIGDENIYLNLSMSILMQIRAQEAAHETYNVDHNSFLWVKSIWIADVPWSNAVPSYSTFKSTVGGYMDDDNKGEVYVGNDTLFNDLKSEKAYNIVTAKVRGDSSLNSHNGYLIMVVLVVGLSLVSQLISTRQQKKAGQMNGQGAGMMKVMMWIMPIMLGVFAFTSSSAFTLYMVTNSIMTLIINFATTFIVNCMDGSFKNKENQIVKYGRQDPNDIINGKNKK